MIFFSIYKSKTKYGTTYILKTEFWVSDAWIWLDIIFFREIHFMIFRPTFYFNFSSAGGLVTAVAPVVIDCDGLWVGWTGLHDFNPAIEKIPESDADDRAPTAGLLSRQAISGDFTSF